jgi:hypothetical protein
LIENGRERRLTSGGKDGGGLLWRLKPNDLRTEGERKRGRAEDKLNWKEGQEDGKEEAVIASVARGAGVTGLGGTSYSTSSRPTARDGA